MSDPYLTSKQRFRRRFDDHVVTRLLNFTLAASCAWFAIHRLDASWGPCVVPLFYLGAVRLAYLGIRGAKELP